MIQVSIICWAAFKHQQNENLNVHLVGLTAASNKTLKMQSGGLRLYIHMYLYYPMYKL